MKTRPTVDVLILGGGPAGAVAALELAKCGTSVAVLERSAHSSERVGETLPPEAAPLLHRLGLWAAFWKDAHLPSPGIVSVWGNEQPHENDFIFNPYGHGWHLDRARFDRTLAAAAEAAGARVWRGARVRSCMRIEDRGWSLKYECEGTVREIAAHYLIDATGRSTWFARQQGATRRVLDRLVGVIGFAEGSADGDPRTLLEATADGWWYAARLPHGKVVAAFMTDADLLPRGNDQLKRFWGERLRSAPLTTALCPNPNEVGELRVMFSGTVRLDRCHGPGWLAVGDAALAFDPLSSQGVVKALESGWRAAAAVTELLRGNGNALISYAEWLEAAFATYTQSYFHYYGQVRRWPDAVFWRRRFSPVDTSARRGFHDAI
jgi:flavin-dependent dehydrogenase